MSSGVSARSSDAALLGRGASLLLIQPLADGQWGGAPPYELLLLAAVLERVGHQVRVLDFNVEALDFGVLADVLAEVRVQWVVIAADASYVLEAYRIGRFVKAMEKQRTVLYVGRHVMTHAAEALAVGAGDAAVIGEAIAVMPCLLRGGSEEVVAGVVRRGGVSVCGEAAAEWDADRLPGPAFHRAKWQRYGRLWERAQLGGGPVGDLRSVFGESAGQRRVRSVRNAVSDAEELVTLGVQGLHWLDEDWLADGVRARQFCDELRSRRLGVRWICEATVASVRDGGPVLALMAAAGCVAVELRLTSGDEVVRSATESGTSDREVLAADAALRAAGLRPQYHVTTWGPGETLDSALRTQRLLRALGAASVRVEFFTPRAGTVSVDGVVLARSWGEHRDDQLSYVPATVVHDVPVRQRGWSTERLQSWWVEEGHGMTAAWLQGGIYVRSQLIECCGGMKGWLGQLEALYEAVDGKRNVSALIQSRSGILDWEITLAGLAMLLTCGAVGRQPSLESGVPAVNAVGDEGGRTEAAFFCSRPWTGFEVGEEDGVVWMCCWAKGGYGNVNTHSVAEIWNGPRIRDMRRKMAQGRWQEICRPECPYIAGYMSDPVPEPKSAPFAENLALNLIEIAERKEVLQSLPRFWKAAHSTLCNLDCIMCYQDRKSKQKLPQSFYEQLQQCYPVIQELLLLGGEPLVIREMRELLARASPHLYPDLHFALITNGTIYDPRTMDLAAGANLAWVLISIDAATPATYAHIRRPGRLERTLEGVKAWKRLRDEYGFSLVLSFTIMRDNIHELAEFVKLGHDHGIDCQFSRVSGTKAGQHLIDPSDLDSEVSRALETLSVLGATEMMTLAHSSLQVLHIGN